MGYMILILLGICLVLAVVFYVAYRILDDCRGQLAALENDLHVSTLFQEARKKFDILSKKKEMADTVAGYAFWATFLGLLLCAALFVFWRTWWN